ncbi:MAG: tetratricopeptide repeat protein [Candidatus Latescibacterota bacterium]|nr:MAG: tetratricopeptide repeat protein [Candidatus Latescibacterota bacterium]
MAKKSKKTKLKKPAPVTVFENLSSSNVWVRRDLRNVIVTLGVALLVRLVFYFLNKENNPLFHYPIMDGKYHHEWAQEILSGNFWGDEVFFRAPLYPYFLALLYKISGSSIGFAVFCQHVIGSVSAVLVYLLTRRFFRPGLALLAGLFAALYWPFLYFEADLLIVTLVVFLDLLALFWLVVGLQNQRAVYLVLAGLVLGLSAIARPSVLIFYPLIPAVFYLCQRQEIRRGARGHKRWIRQTVFVYTASAVIITPVIVRNTVIGRDFVPIASQGGVNFYIGNNPQADGRTAIVPGTRWDWWGGYEDAIRIAETESGRRLKPSEVSVFYFRKGLDFIVTSPDKSIPLLGKKLYLFWAGGERSNNKYIYFFWQKSGMDKVPLPGFWLVAPLGLLGGVLLWRRKPEFWPLHLFVLSYMIGVVAFFVNARFRLPVVPVLVVFAAYAVFHIVWVLRFRRSDLWRPLVILGICVFVVDFDFVHFGENKTYADSISHYTLGNAYLNMGDTEKAIQEYEEASDTYRKYPRPGYRLIARNVDYNLGRLYWAQDRCPDAIERLKKVGGNDQYTILAFELLADCYVREGRSAEATDVFQQILRAVPAHRKATFGLANAYRLAGQPERAEEVLRTFISQSTGQDAEAHFELAVTLEMQERWNDAIENFLVATKSPAYRGKSYLALANLYKTLGDKENALDYFTRAKTALPDDTTIQREIETLRRGE